MVTTCFAWSVESSLQEMPGATSSHSGSDHCPAPGRTTRPSPSAAMRAARRACSEAPGLRMSSLLIACLAGELLAQPAQCRADARLYRAQRLVQTRRGFGMGQAMEERGLDRAPLGRGQRIDCAAQRAAL